MRTLGAAGAVCGFLGVALGAFGAHALKTRLSPEMLAVYHTGTEYHLAHALAILLTVALAAHLPEAGKRLALRAGWLFVAGIVVFGGSLYILALTGEKNLGRITPLGEVCFLTGWAMLAAAFLQKEKAEAL